MYRWWGGGSTGLGNIPKRYNSFWLLSLLVKALVKVLNAWVRLIIYSARWSFSFILGPLHWSSVSSVFPTSREYRNIVQWCTVFFCQKNSDIVVDQMWILDGHCFFAFVRVITSQLRVGKWWWHGSCWSPLLRWFRLPSDDVTPWEPLTLPVRWKIPAFALRHKARSSAEQYIHCFPFCLDEKSELMPRTCVVLQTER